MEINSQSQVRWIRTKIFPIRIASLSIVTIEKSHIFIEQRQI